MRSFTQLLFWMFFFLCQQHSTTIYCINKVCFLTATAAATVSCFVCRCTANCVHQISCVNVLSMCALATTSAVVRMHNRKKEEKNIENWFLITHWIKLHLKCIAEKNWLQYRCERKEKRKKEKLWNLSVIL